MFEAASYHATQIDLAAAMRQPATFRARAIGTTQGGKTNHCDGSIALKGNETVDEAYARGLAEGQKLADISFAIERKALLQLLASAEALDGVPCSDLGVLIGTAVTQLVGSILGSAPVDVDWLREQVEEASAVINAADQDRVLHLHPLDAALLADCPINMPILPDDQVERGALRIETGQGWVEHGRPAYLAAIHALLGHGSAAQ